jgi:hypothetical protein
MKVSKDMEHGLKRKKNRKLGEAPRPDSDTGGPTCLRNVALSICRHLWLPYGNQGRRLLRNSAAKSVIGTFAAGPGGYLEPIKETPDHSGAGRRPSR